MASYVLSANDFQSNGDVRVLLTGELFIPKAINPDFSLGIVSKNAYSVNVNKSIVVDFKVDPYTEAIREPKVYVGPKTIAYINANKHLIINGEDKGQVSDNAQIKGHGDLVALLDQNKLTVFNDNNDTADNVKYFDVGEGFVAYITNEDKPQVRIIGKDADDSVGNIPDSVNSYKEETEEPIEVACGNNFVYALKSNGQTIGWGKGARKLDESVALSIRAYGTKVGYINTSNNLIVEDVESNSYTTYSNVEFFVIDNDSVSFVNRNGVTYLNEEKQNFKYPVEIFSNGNVTFAALRDGTIITNNDDLKNTIPFKAEINTSDDFNNYPLLKRVDAFTIFFGIQKNNLDPDVTTAVSLTGESTKIITGSTNNDSVFKELGKNAKGFILSKYVDGSDLFYNVKGRIRPGFYADNFQFVDEEFIDFNENTYRIVISFTPFGKYIRLFKGLWGTFTEIGTKFLSVEEQPFEVGNIAIYIKSAANLVIERVEITDELDTSLLPEEIIYRDIDTAILQTKVAESLNKHVEALDEATSTIEELTKALANVTQSAKAKFEDLEKRVSELEKNANNWWVIKKTFN